MNPYVPQCVSALQAAQQTITRVIREGSVLSSRVVSAAAGDGTVPLILLHGRRLTRLGFRAGARIRVDASVGRIVITLLGVKAPLPESMPMNFRRYQRERPRRVAGCCGHVQRNHGGVPCLAEV